MFQNQVSKFVDLDYKEVEGFMMDEEADGKDGFVINKISSKITDKSTAVDGKIVV